jgi:hypothetical protein
MFVGHLGLVHSGFVTIFVVFKMLIEKIGPLKLNGRREITNATIDSLNLGRNGELLKSLLNHDGIVDFEKELRSL